MMNQECCEVNCKRLVLTIVAVFVYLFASDFLIHGVLLEGAYMETASSWRTKEDMQQYMGWLIAGQFFISTFFSILYVKTFKEKSIKKGACYGFAAGGLLVSPYFIQYAVMPLPQTIMWSWIVCGLIQATLGGVVASLVYQKPAV